MENHPTLSRYRFLQKLRTNCGVPMSELKLYTVYLSNGLRTIEISYFIFYFQEVFLVQRGYKFYPRSLISDFPNGI